MSTCLEIHVDLPRDSCRPASGFMSTCLGIHVDLPRDSCRPASEFMSTCLGIHVDMQTTASGYGRACSPDESIILSTCRQSHPWMITAASTSGHATRSGCSRRSAQGHWASVIWRVNGGTPEAPFSQPVQILHGPFVVLSFPQPAEILRGRIRARAHSSEGAFQTHTGRNEPAQDLRCARRSLGEEEAMT
jgi:hypothetical protein